MRVMYVSKALVVATYRGKLRELSALGVDMIAVVPPYWREAGSIQRLEPLTDAGFEAIITPMRLNGHFHGHYYPELRRLIAVLKPDIVHMDEEPYNLATFLGIHAAQHQNVPSLFYSWQNLTRTYPPPFRWMEQYCYKHAALAQAGSEPVADVLRAKGFGGRISVIPQFGVDAELFTPRARLGRPFTVLFPNRLVSGKAPLLALRAFARLPHDAVMNIVGDGPLLPAVRAEIERLTLQRRVTVQSRVPSGQMPDLYSSADVVLLPSVSTPRWKEQFGRVLIEAMSCGTVIIGSDSGEIPRVVDVAGLIVPEGDEEALAGAMLQVYRDASLRIALGTRARERVLQHFTNRALAQQTLDAYTGVIGTAVGR